MLPISVSCPTVLRMVTKTDLMSRESGLQGAENIQQKNSYSGSLVLPLPGPLIASKFKDNMMGHIDPITHYKAVTPLRSDSKFYRQDITKIRTASHKSEVATKLVAQRCDEKIVKDIDRELDQMGRKRPIYDQGTVLMIEHLWPHPYLDPTTQRPILERLLVKAKGGTLRRREFIESAVAILNQDYLLAAA